MGNIQTNSWETLKKRRDETKRENRSTAKSVSGISSSHLCLRRFHRLREIEQIFASH